MANLAIKGHTKRGKEVIEILEMLGYINQYNYSGDADSLCFYSNENTNIICYDWVNSCYEDEDVIVFTLEEFEAKFPYKIGDKVMSLKGVGIITEMKWLDVDNEVRYRLSIKNDIDRWFYAKDLQLYKEQENMERDKTIPSYMDYNIKTEETMEEKTDKALAPDLKGEDYSGRRFGYKIPNGYEFDCIKNNEIILKPKQLQYPKTYEECSELLGCDDKIRLYIIGEFIRLINARNAYWKIAGEQMGLGKPWKPDWTDTQQMKHSIWFDCDGVCLKSNRYSYAMQHILTFPIKEMRDTFYENFKESIELCKNLL